MDPVTPTPERPTVVVAGATGFIGERLISRLLPSVRVHALSRRARTGFTKGESEGPLCLDCDLFSMRDTRSAVEGADIAVYLVHSMLHSARLTQGSFHDMDRFWPTTLRAPVLTQGQKDCVFVGTGTGSGRLICAFGQPGRG